MKPSCFLLLEEAVPFYVPIPYILVGRINATKKFKLHILIYFLLWWILCYPASYRMLENYHRHGHVGNLYFGLYSKMQILIGCVCPVV